MLHLALVLHLDNMEGHAVHAHETAPQQRRQDMAARLEGSSAHVNLL